MSHADIQRRTVLAGLAASAAFVAVKPAFAFSEVQVGEARLIALSDGSLAAPSNFFGGLTEAQTASVGEMVTLAANTYAYRTANRVVLFDAGVGTGNFMSERFQTMGQLPADLAAAGITADEVTDIVVTHMHVDHIGGLVVDGAPAFPSATIHVSATDWGFWTKEGLADAVPDGAKPMVLAAQSISAIVGDAVRSHAGEADLGDGIGLIPAPGHTPGHSAILLSSGSEQIMLLGDAVMHESVHFANPEASWVIEADKAVAAQTRRTLLDRAVADGIRIAGSHLTAPGIGRVERDGSAYRFVPQT